MDMCTCGWSGEDFEKHREDTRYDDEQTHVQTTPDLDELFPRTSGMRL